MKNTLLFNAGVLVLVASFAQLGVCQNRTEPSGVTSLSDCSRGREAGLPHLIIEQIVASPSFGKPANPKFGATSDQVQEAKVAVNGRLLTVITGHAGDKSCILREDWDNTQASVNNER